MRRIGNFFNLCVEEKTIFLRALALLVFSRSSLQFQNFKDVVTNVSRKTATQKSNRISSVSPARVASLLNAAGKVVPFTTCLSKALAGSILFSSLGYRTELHIGVSREDRKMLEAHAWLTYDGRVIIGYLSDLGRYVELPISHELHE